MYLKTPVPHRAHELVLTREESCLGKSGAVGDWKRMYEARGHIALSSGGVQGRTADGLALPLQQPSPSHSLGSPEWEHMWPVQTPGLGRK